MVPRGFCFVLFFLFHDLDAVGQASWVERNRPAEPLWQHSSGHGPSRWPHPVGLSLKSGQTCVLSSSRRNTAKVTDGTRPRVHDEGVSYRRWCHPVTCSACPAAAPLPTHPCFLASGPAVAASCWRPWWPTRWPAFGDGQQGAEVLRPGAKSRILSTSRVCSECLLLGSGVSGDHSPPSSAFSALGAPGS